jgi:hypothetical protein
MNIQEMKERMAKALEQARAISAKCEEEGRDFEGDERQNVMALVKEAGDLKAKIKAAESDDSIRKQLADLGADYDLLRQDDKPAKKSIGAKGGEGQTIGERVINAKAWKDWYSQTAPGGIIPESRKGINSPAIEIGKRPSSPALARPARARGLSPTKAVFTNRLAASD